MKFRLVLFGYLLYIALVSSFKKNSGRRHKHRAISFSKPVKNTTREPAGFQKPSDNHVQFSKLAHRHKLQFKGRKDKPVKKNVQQKPKVIVVKVHQSKPKNIKSPSKSPSKVAAAQKNENENYAYGYYDGKTKTARNEEIISPSTNNKTNVKPIGKKKQGVTKSKKTVSSRDATRQQQKQATQESIMFRTVDEYTKEALSNVTSGLSSKNGEEGSDTKHKKFHVKAPNSQPARSSGKKLRLVPTTQIQADSHGGNSHTGQSYPNLPIPPMVPIPIFYSSGDAESSSTSGTGEVKYSSSVGEDSLDASDYGYYNPQANADLDKSDSLHEKNNEKDDGSNDGNQEQKLVAPIQKHKDFTHEKPSRHHHQLKSHQARFKNTVKGHSQRYGYYQQQQHIQHQNGDESSYSQPNYDASGTQYQQPAVPQYAVQPFTLNSDNGDAGTAVGTDQHETMPQDNVGNYVIPQNVVAASSTPIQPLALNPNSETEFGKCMSYCPSTCEPLCTPECCNRESIQPNSPLHQSTQNTKQIVQFGTNEAFSNQGAVQSQMNSLPVGPTVNSPSEQITYGGSSQNVGSFYPQPLEMQSSEQTTNAVDLPGKLKLQQLAPSSNTDQLTSSMVSSSNTAPKTALNFQNIASQNTEVVPEISSSYAAASSNVPKPTGESQMPPVSNYVPSSVDKNPLLKPVYPTMLQEPQMSFQATKDSSGMQSPSSSSSCLNGCSTKCQPYCSNLCCGISAA